MMRWPRDRAIWLAATVGFLLGLGSGRIIEQVAAATQGPVAPSRPLVPWRYLALFGIIVALGCAALVGWQVSEASQEATIGRSLTGGDPAHGPMLMIRYGCSGCHTIPGVPGANGQVGPALSDLRQRVYVGGVVRNTAGNLIDWIVDPRALSPRTAMPVTGISQAEARDVAAYLYSR
jgi:cytochrome c2